MELKDVILSTIAELGDETDAKKLKTSLASKSVREMKEEISRQVLSKEAPSDILMQEEESFVEEEREFLEHMRERILVLFEGFQSPNNSRIEAKIDLTLNFLEYLLATLDERIETLKKS
ncbi:hypothetical protein [Hydrogenimonas sp.]|uniref:CiaD-like domain-containing protein n=1 Tax=Hydrogenimonas sp. TaxID=2231112 RepID=UPI00260778E5|nr:hypothetical protein [Hydrogenimonas sp.]